MARFPLGVEINGKIEEGDPMTTAGNLLTQRQILYMRQLPADHDVVSLEGRAPIVRKPDGGLLRIRPSGRVVEANPVERVRSYLHVRG